MVLLLSSSEQRFPPTRPVSAIQVYCDGEPAPWLGIQDAVGMASDGVVVRVRCPAGAERATVKAMRLWAWKRNERSTAIRFRCRTGVVEVARRMS